MQSNSAEKASQAETPQPIQASPEKKSQRTHGVFYRLAQSKPMLDLNEDLLDLYVNRTTQSIKRQIIQSGQTNISREELAMILDLMKQLTYDNKIFWNALGQATWMTKFYIDLAAKVAEHIGAPHFDVVWLIVNCDSAKHMTVEQVLQAAKVHILACVTKDLNLPPPPNNKTIIAGKASKDNVTWFAPAVHFFVGLAEAWDESLIEKGQIEIELAMARLIEHSENIDHDIAKLDLLRVVLQDTIAERKLALDDAMATTRLLLKSWEKDTDNGFDLLSAEFTATNKSPPKLLTKWMDEITEERQSVEEHGSALGEDEPTLSEQTDEEEGESTQDDDPAAQSAEDSEDGQDN